MVNPAVKERAHRGTTSTTRKSTKKPTKKASSRGGSSHTSKSKALDNAVEQQNKGRKRGASTSEPAPAGKRARQSTDVHPVSGDGVSKKYAAPVEITAPVVPGSGTDDSVKARGKQRVRDKQPPPVDDSEPEPSEGALDTDAGSDNPSDTESTTAGADIELECPKWKTVSNASTKVPGKREQVRQAEKPQWKTPGKTNEDSDEALPSGDEDADDEGNTTDSSIDVWPITTDLVFHDQSRYIRILDQQPEIQEVIRLAIQILSADALFLTFFPRPDEFFRILRNTLRKASHKLKQEVICLRIKEDVSYAKALTHPVKARFFNLRCDLADLAQQKTEGFFGLFPGCQALVQCLITGNTFIYPPASADKPVHQSPARDKPYLNPALKAIVASVFWDARAVGTQNLSRFVTSLPDDPTAQEPEVTIPLVAYAAAMVHAALLCWKTGQYHQVKFNADEHYNTYTQHVNLLNAIRTRKPKTFHHVMAELLSDAVNGAHLETTTTNDADALANMDFDAMDD